jgi:hypothetical protein
MQLTIEQVFSNDDLTDLRATGYGTGRLQIGDAMLHVTAIEVSTDDDGYTADRSTVLGSESDFDAIFNLMGDNAGPPMLLDWEGRTYLLGACPYGR